MWLEQVASRSSRGVDVLLSNSARFGVDFFWVGGGGVLGITRGDRRWSESMETNRDGVWSSSGEDAL